MDKVRDEFEKLFKDVDFSDMEGKSYKIQAYEGFIAGYEAAKSEQPEEKIA